MGLDEDTVMISAIEHYSYCPRQCALIHVEQVYDENVFTLRGSRAHERTDVASWEMDGTTRIERALPLWCDRLALNGRGDTVEFRADGSVYPVEYKHGPRRPAKHDDLQLCAQAACLEEMLGVSVPAGAIYYHSTKRRRELVFTRELHAEMEQIVAAILAMRRIGQMPPPVNDARCPNCSLVGACVPAVIEEGRTAWHLRDLFRVSGERGDDHG